MVARAKPQGLELLRPLGGFGVTGLTKALQGLRQDGGIVLGRQRSPVAGGDGAQGGGFSHALSLGRSRQLRPVIHCRSVN